MLFTAATQTVIGFPQSLSEKYRPRVFADFVGLEKQKKMLAKFAANPYASSWLFVGPSGVGKTTMALALAEAIRAEVHHIPSQKCTAGEVDDVVRRCWYAPMNGTLHLVLCDEADRMTPAAQLALLSKLDSTAAPPQTVWVFTANDTEGLQDRFLSRTRRIEFSSYGIADETAKFLETVWEREAPNAEKPNFARIVKESRNNVRDCLMTIETELLAA